MTAGNGTGAPIVVKEIGKETLRALAPLPATAVQLMALLDDPLVSLRRVAETASRDVGITASMLRMANSPAFGLPSQVGSVADAVRVIGIVQARLLILACGVAQVGQKALPLYGLVSGAFVRHSEQVAMLSAAFAKQAGYENKSIAYSTGLLHDIGKVVLNGLSRQRGIGSAEEMTALQASGVSLTEIERTWFATDHTIVGRDLLALWALPEEICSAVLQHHTAAEREEGQTPLASCIALANTVAGALDPLYPASNRAPFPLQPALPAEEALTLAGTLLRAEATANGGTPRRPVSNAR